MFELFTNAPYTFLQLGTNFDGNYIVKEFSAEGIVKLRDGMVQADNMEAYNSTSTIHVKPSEPFLAVVQGNMVGHGIRAIDNTGEPVEYRIDGQVEGMDFDTGKLEFYKVTLKKESIVSWPSDLPLE